MSDNLSLRGILITVFCAYIGFVVAGLALYGMVDDTPFIPVTQTHFDLAISWLTIAGGSAVALFAIVVGGLPIGFGIVRRAISARRKDLLLLMSVPVVALVVLGAFILVVLAIDTRFFSTTPGQIDLGQSTRGWAPTVLALLFLTAAIASTAAVCLAVLRTNMTEQTFRLKGITIIVEPYTFALLPATATTLAMGLMLVGTIAWGLFARVEAPFMVNSQADMPILGGLTYAIWWLVIVVVMAVSTLIAGAAVARGYTTHQS